MNWSGGLTPGRDAARLSAACTGVVDGNNKIFGVENLYVSGACVFPLSGATNPTNTVVALTLRLADHLAARSRN